MEKAIVVEIEDLREIVGGAAEISIKEQEGALGHPQASAIASSNSTSMCWYSPTPTASDWIVIKGE